MLNLLERRGSIWWCVLLIWSAVVASAPIVRTAEKTAEEFELGKIKLKDLKETSGLAASRRNADVVWLHNDGDAGDVYAMRTSGKLAAVVHSPAKVEDMEDIAIGPGPMAGRDYLYLGDIGDNDARRRDVRVLRFAEPSLEGVAGGQLEAADVETIRLKYADGGHDAEALLVDPATGDIYVVTKEKKRARLYRVAASKLGGGAPATLEKVATLDVDEVSAGDISNDGRRIVLRREGRGWLWNRRDGESVADAMGRQPVEIPVCGDRQGKNGEAIGFAPDGNRYFTVSEGQREIICEFRLLPAAESAGK